MSRVYLGIACSNHDSAVAVVDSEGRVVYAQATERSVQLKRALFMVPISKGIVHRALGPVLAPEDELVVAYSWALGGQIGRALDGWCLERDPRKLEPAAAAGAFLGMKLARDISYLELCQLLPAGRPAPEPLFLDHHLTHAYAACYASPYDEAVCAVIDGGGDEGSLAFYRFEGASLVRIDSARVGDPKPGSLGRFYAALCGAVGFDAALGEEWKVMGLAAYGRFDPELYSLLKPLASVSDLELESHASWEDEDAIWQQAKARYSKGSERGPLAFADLAHTGQVLFEDASAALLSNLRARGLSEHLVLTGGCALNSSWNGRLLARTGFRSLFVPSAPADDGNAVGAAWMAFQRDHPGFRPPGRALTAYLGDRLDGETLNRSREVSGLRLGNPEGVPVTRRAAELLAQGKIVGWVQGRAEFGPRALGNRSILADPRVANIKDVLNARVKFREEFRPFAPAILHEYGPEYFEDYQDSPYMERTLVLREGVQERIPGAIHVDGSGRLQSVTAERNPRFHELLAEFHRLTGVPLVINTSFNVMGKPILHSVEDALAVYVTSGIDALVIEDVVFEK